MKLAVLVSGQGTLLDSIASAGIPIEVVMADRDCPAMKVAEDHGIKPMLMERRGYGQRFDRDTYTRNVTNALLMEGIDLVAMAGWGTIFAQPIFDIYPNHILNTHPSLLPSFKGWHAVRDALAAGVKVTGCTVHLLRLELDDGPIIAQRAVDVVDGDTEDTLHERIKQTERVLYPETIKRIVADPDMLRSL